MAQVYFWLAVGSAILLALTFVLGELFEGLDEIIEGMGGDLFPDAGGALQGFFSLKTLLAFLAMFGATGYWLTTDFGLGSLPAFVVAIIAGCIVGGLVGMVVNYFSTISSSAHITDEDYFGAKASVTSAIPEGGVGEVSLHIKGGLKSISARSESGSRLPYGTPVTIIKKDGTTVTVRPLE